MPIISTPLTTSNVDGFYYHKVQATGGVEPYLWELCEAPDGMAIQPLPDGCAILTWSPTKTGAYDVVVKAIDCNGKEATQSWTIAVDSKCNCNSGSIKSLILQCITDLRDELCQKITDLRDQTQSWLEALQALVETKVDKATVNQCIAEAIAQLPPPLTEERVCELIEEKKDDDIEPKKQILSASTPNHFPYDDGGDCATQASTINWNGCSYDNSISAFKLFGLNSNNAVWVADEAGTYDVSIVSNSLSTSSDYASVALTVLRYSDYLSLVDNDGDTAMPDGCSLLDLWAEMIGTIAQDGTDPCAGSNVSMPSTVTLAVGDRVYISGITDSDVSSEITLGVEVCLTKQS